LVSCLLERNRDLIKLNEFEASLSERLLINLHNLCATSGEMARKSEDLAQIVQTDTNTVNQNMDKHISDGYVEAYYDNEGNRRFYLTRRGIIRVCSLFS
jgi:predicted ArsR family transcriptional regulator